MFHINRSYENGIDRTFRNVGTNFRRGGIIYKEEYKGRTLAANHGTFKSRSVVIHQEDYM